MTAERLLAELETLGVRLAVDGERLRVNAAAGVVGDALKAPHKRQATLQSA